MLARAGAHIDQVIGGADGVFVMFDHDHGVIQIAQAHQRADQTVVIALMQANRRFVQHIHHAGQTRTDLRSQPNPLRLAARQRVGAAFQA